MHHEPDELRHRQSLTAPLVGLDDVGADPLDDVVVRQQRAQRRLVQHDGAGLLRVRQQPGQCGDRAAAGGEDVHRAEPRRLDNPVHVVAVDVVLDLPALLELAALGHPRVVGDHGPVGEVRQQLLETGRGHRRAEDEERPVRSAAFGLVHVVRQDGAGHVKLMGGRGHRISSEVVVQDPTRGATGTHRWAGTQSVETIPRRSRPIAARAVLRTGESPAASAIWPVKSISCFIWRTKSPAVRSPRVRSSSSWSPSAQR